MFNLYLSTISIILFVTLALSFVTGCTAATESSQSSSSAPATLAPNRDMRSPSTHQATARATATIDMEENALVQTYSRRTQFVPLDNPKFIPSSQASYLRASERVLGVTVNGESRAYPVNMMTYHHIANDTIGGKPILITF